MSSTLAAHLAHLPRSGQVYLNPIDERFAGDWRSFQERERAFWHRKITQTDYAPDPVADFQPFLGHWGIDAAHFQGKGVLEIGTGPFGFFSAIGRMAGGGLPDELVLMDPLMEFYQQFSLFDYMPESAVRLQAQGEAIPFPDASFDCIVTTNTIDHVADCGTFLREVARVLRRGGTLFFSVHVLAGSAMPLKPLIKLLDKNHPYHFQSQEVRRLLADSGLVPIREVLVPMHLENRIPPEADLIGKLVYTVGFRLMNTLYGVARHGEP